MYKYLDIMTLSLCNNKIMGQSKGNQFLGVVIPFDLSENVLSLLSEVSLWFLDLRKQPDR